MTDRIGPTFAAELKAAGCADGVAWHPGEATLVFNAGVPQAAIDAARAVLAAHDPTKTSPPAVPDGASKLGLKRALDELGLWEPAKTAIANIPAVQEEWDLAIEIKRTDHLTAGIIAVLGLTPDQVDGILVRAAALVS